VQLRLVRVSVRRVAALVVTFASLISPSLAQTGVPAAPESHRWGINATNTATGLLPDLETGLLPDADLLVRARQAGFGWVRYYLSWNLANPWPPWAPAELEQFQWFASDVEIARLNAAGFNVLVQVVYPPAWTLGATYPNFLSGAYCLDEKNPPLFVRNDPFNCGSPERRPGYRAEYSPENGHSYPPGYDRSRDFRTFVAAAAERYKGKVKAWGFSVEVHSKLYWQGNVRQLVDEILRPGYEEVKKVDPTVLVVGPDEDVEDALDIVLKTEAEDVAAGKPRLFDVLSSHGFAHSGWTTPDQLEREWRAGPLPEALDNLHAFGSECSFESAQQLQTNKNPLLCSTKTIIERHRKGRPFWFTEFGYRVADPFDPVQAVAASQYLSTWIQGITERPWIDKAFLYALRFDYPGPPGDFGMFMKDEGNPAVPALATVSNILSTRPPPQASYLAEGATGPFFDLDVAVANPNAVPAPVKVSFLKPDGSVELLTETLAPMSRRTYRVEQLPGLPSLASTDVSTVVESTTGVPLVTERTMFWDGGYYGGHGGTAVSAPATTWYFGEGSQGYFDTYVLLANSGTAPAHVTITFLLEGAPPVVLERVVLPTSRQNVWAGEVADRDDPTRTLDGRSFAIRVDADVPIIAERAMYFGKAPLPFWNGGHESAGVSSLSTTWFHAEGATGRFFDEYILVGNPGDDAAEVTFTFLLESGQTVVASREVPARSRYTLDVENAAAFVQNGLLTAVSGDLTLLADAAVSTRVQSTVPIVSERAMYWPGDFTTWAEAHNSFGVTETGTRWGLAEGRTGGPRGFETFILMANPGDRPAHVRITYLRPDGSTLVRESCAVSATNCLPVVGATSRSNEWVNAVIPVGEFGALIESTNGVPIVVERAMYWNGPGAPFWAGGTNATATKLP
jgi:hypothetical protein